MTDTANDSMTAAEYRAQQAESGRRVASLPAVAVDPGTTTGVAVAFADGEIKTRTTTFWDEMERVFEFGSPRIATMQDPTYIVEAPYLTRWGVHGPDNRRQVYNSGGAAREASLLVEGLERRGYDVVEHDPHDQGQKYDSKTLRGIVGNWGGADNEHVRDAVRLLVWYDVV